MLIECSVKAPVTMQIQFHANTLTRMQHLIEFDASGESRQEINQAKKAIFDVVLVLRYFMIESEAKTDLPLNHSLILFQTTERSFWEGIDDDDDDEGLTI